MEYQYFRIEPRSVIFERFEGEVIAINLDRGTYYSLNPAAADIFELVAGQAARADIIAALEHKYSAGTGTIRDEVTRFLQTLEAEGLIQSASSAGPGAAPVAAGSGAQAVFEAPTLSVHRDMQELFLLDPVHDVTDAGWPEQRPAER
jgi:hypothetical protein